MIKLLKELKNDTSGNVTVEVGLVFIILSGLALGAADYGKLIYEQHRLSQVVRAGLQVGLQSQTDAGDLVAIKLAAKKAAGDIADTITFSVGNSCKCPGSWDSVDCGEYCDDDAFPRMYMTVSATRQIDFLFGLPGTEFRTISANATMRAR